SNEATNDGNVQIETPDGYRLLAWSDLTDESGAFLSANGWGRSGVAGLVFDANGGPVSTETNLFVEVSESSSWMRRDKMNDQLDALILGLGKERALAALESSGNPMQKKVVDLAKARPGCWVMPGMEE